MPLDVPVSNGSGSAEPRASAFDPQGKGFLLKDFIVRRDGGLIEAEVDGELIGLEVEKGLCYGFNGTATRIWALIEKPKRLSELQARLLEEYDVEPETCARELRAILDELQRDGLVAMEPIDA
jgi:hypothetical protein